MKKVIYKILVVTDCVIFLVTYLLFLFLKNDLFYYLSILPYIIFMIFICDAITEEFNNKYSKNKKLYVRFFFFIFIMLPYISFYTNSSISFYSQLIIVSIASFVVFLFNYIKLVKRFIRISEYGKYIVDIFLIFGSLVFAYSIMWEKSIDITFKKILIPMTIMLGLYRILLLKASELQRKVNSEKDKIKRIRQIKIKVRA